MKKTTCYNGEKFTVDSETLAIEMNGQTLKPYFNKQVNRYYVSYKDNTGASKFVPRARIICKAFHPNANYQSLQTDHIDSNSANDNPSNLRWATRKENNSTEHAREMKSKNARQKSHKHEILKATNECTGEIMYFANGKHCAQVLGCSAPFVYIVSNEDFPTYRTAKGWNLEWTIVDQPLIDALKRDRHIKTYYKTTKDIDRQISRLQKRIDYYKMRNDKRNASLQQHGEHHSRAAATFRMIKSATLKISQLEEQIMNLEDLRQEIA